MIHPQLKGSKGFQAVISIYQVARINLFYEKEYQLTRNEVLGGGTVEGGGNI